MRNLCSVFCLPLLFMPLGARAEQAVGAFSAVMTSPAAPNRRALIVTPAFSGGSVNARAALARSDAVAYRDLLRLLGFSGTIIAADTRPALRAAVQSFADAVPRDAEVAVLVLGSIVPAGGKLYVPASDLSAADRASDHIATAGLDLAVIVGGIAEHGAKDVVAIVDECGGGEAKPDCDMRPNTLPDGVSAIVVHRVPGRDGEPVAGVASVRQDLLPLMREPGLDILQLYSRLKSRLSGTNDGLVATPALSRNFVFLPGDFLARLPVECNNVDPSAEAEALRRAPSLAPKVAACERAAATYDFSPFFKERLTAAREQLAFQKAVAGCGGRAAAYLDAYPNGAYRVAVSEQTSACERAAQTPAAELQARLPASTAPSPQDQGSDEASKSQPKPIYILDHIPGNVLYLRDGAGSHFRALAAMPAGTDDLYADGECRKGDPSDRWLWCHVAWRGLSGWASSCCLAPKALITTANGTSGLFEVPDDIPGGVLNLRSGASFGSHQVTSIPAGSKNLHVGQCQMPPDNKGRPYCHVRWQSFDGWASSYYLQPSTGTQPGARQ